MDDKTLLDDILYRYKHPRHKAINPTDSATPNLPYSAHAENASCGDLIDLHLTIKDNVIVEATFSGAMCSIANYGAELLLDQAIGQPLVTAQQITSINLLPANCSLLNNPVRLKCFDLAEQCLSRIVYK